MSIPDFYDKVKPPEMPKKLEKANPINIPVITKNIDFVNTISMSVGLTITGILEIFSADLLCYV